MFRLGLGIGMEAGERLGLYIVDATFALMHVPVRCPGEWTGK